MARPKKSQAQPTVEPSKLPYIHVPGLPTADPSSGILDNRADLPLVCRVCSYPLVTLQRSDLSNPTIKLICLGRCVDVIRKDQTVIDELKLTPEEANILGNVYTVSTLEVVKILNDSKSVDERTILQEDSQPAQDLDGEGLLSSQ